VGLAAHEQDRGDVGDRPPPLLEHEVGVDEQPLPPLVVALLGALLLADVAEVVQQPPDVEVGEDAPGNRRG